MAGKIEILTTPCDGELSRWFAPLLREGTTFAAPNLRTKLLFLRTIHGELPLTVNETEWDNSYICSPWTHYITCCISEAAKLQKSWWKTSGLHLLNLAGKWLRKADFNRVVMVNNRLLSTNPWPRWPAEGMRCLVPPLCEAFPDHAILFRSLNDRESPGVMRGLASAGARLIPSRQVWWFEPHSSAVGTAQNYRKDLRLLRRPDFTPRPHDSLTAEDFPQLARLYHLLYIEKYSPSNPQFTAAWLHHLWKEKLMTYTTLADERGNITGVEATCLLQGVLTSPIVGYDTALPRSLGLYRRLAIIPVKTARERGLPLNLSAGAGQYKALRGGVPVMEFTAVYDRHLPAHRRRAWALIQALCTRILAPLVQRLKL